MIFAATSFKYVFDYQAEDVYWCTADIGWITGHSYLTYGPLANGATSVLVSAVCPWVLSLQEKGDGGAELQPCIAPGWCAGLCEEGWCSPGRAL